MYFITTGRFQSQRQKQVDASPAIMSQSTDFYGYLPSKPAALFGIVYFGTTAIICTLQIIFGKYKHYWMATIALAAVGEALGWGARFWAHIAVCHFI
jgi:hypothetical protein